MSSARFAFAALCSVTLLSAGCGDETSGGPDAATTTAASGATGSGGASTQTSSAAQTSSAQSTSAGVTTARGGGGAESTADASSVGSGGGAAGDSGYAELGVCGRRSEGIVTETSFDTYQEYYLLGDEGQGPEVCVVRFDVSRIGDGPAGCEKFAGQQEECLWTHLVEFTNPRVLIDEEGACANSELGMDAAAIAEIDGRQVAYGYVFEYQGHNSVLMIYDEEQAIWKPLLNAGWGEESGDFRFDERDGFCGY